MDTVLDMLFMHADLGITYDWALGLVHLLLNAAFLLERDRISCRFEGLSATHFVRAIRRLQFHRSTTY